MNKNFTPAMLDTLKVQFETLNSVDPCGVLWKALQGQLAKCSPEQLRTLALADVKFVSLEAASQYKALDQPDSEAVYRSALRRVARRAGRPFGEFPAAACQCCGGWSSSGGMAQHACGPDGCKCRR